MGMRDEIGTPVRSKPLFLNTLSLSPMELRLCSNLITTKDLAMVLTLMFGRLYSENIGNKELTGGNILFFRRREKRAPFFHLFTTLFRYFFAFLANRMYNAASVVMRPWLRSTQSAAAPVSLTDRN